MVGSLTTRYESSAMSDQLSAFSWPSSHVTSTPIRSRPKPSNAASALVLNLSFQLVFALSMILIHALQLLVSPLYLIPQTRNLFRRIITFTKRQYALLLVFITQAFAPTKLVITVDKGSSPRDLVDVDDVDTVIRKLRLPQRSGSCLDNDRRCILTY